jgi:hypothetical protein
VGVHMGEHGSLSPRRALWPRRARLVAPSMGAVILRATQLIILVVISQAANDPLKAPLIASFGIIGAVGVMTDSGAANFLLADRGELSRRLLGRVISIHAGIALSGAVSAIAYSAWRFDPIQTADAIWVVVSLGLTQALDSTTRVCRTPQLAHGADHRYAAVDFLLAALKMPVVVLAYTDRELLWLIGLPVASVCVLLYALQASARLLPTGDPPNRLAGRVLLYGVTGAASALYSQSPLLISSALLPAGEIAVLTLCYRLTQPLELLPATLGQQAMPRFRAGTLALRRYSVGLVGLGGALGLAVFVSLPVIEWAFGAEITPVAVFLVIVASVPIKFGNYGLTAYVLAHGLVHQRLFITVAVGLSAIVAVLAGAVAGSLEAVAAVTLGSEILLSGALLAALRARRLL